jgi:uncharacterized RDD family membrane protein YckC
MERTARIVTGESVAFEYELAGLGSRFIAMLVDLAIQVTTLVVVVLVFAYIGSVDFGTGTIQHVPVSKIAQAVVYSVILIFVFFLFFGYFIVLEWRFARTPGKALLGLRVVRDGGFPLDFTGAVVRNVVRIIEFSIGFYTLSAISALLSPFNRRLGDYAAGTLVVRDNRFERSEIPEYREPPQRSIASDLDPAQRELILQYATRRANFTTTSRDALASRIAAAVRPKLPASFDHLSDDDLLVHLAATAL